MRTMIQLASQEIQLKTRLVHALSVSLMVGGAVLTSQASFASPSAQSSVAGGQPISAIATPVHSLVARSQPRPKKELVATKPGTVSSTSGTALVKRPETPKNSASKNGGTKSSVAQSPVTRTLLTQPPLANLAGASTPAKPVVEKSADDQAALVKAADAKADARLAARAADAKAAQSKAAGEKAKKERLLLAQLEADLLKTEKRLDTTNQKLSAGQKELMSLTSTLQTVMAETGEDAAGLHPFVRVASRYAGTPYVWGGESRYGFDCSGFIIRVMRDLGYKALPHSAAEQFKYGQPVAQSLLKPGDIVFFANTYKPGISHVGIYIGKRRFIHAASTREGTIISSLDASPYKQKYAGARRLLRVKKSA